MYFEGIMLSEKSQTKKNTALYVESKQQISKQTKKQSKANSQVQRIDWWLPEAGWGGMGETG